MSRLFSEQNDILLKTAKKLINGIYRYQDQKGQFGLGLKNVATSAIAEFAIIGEDGDLNQEAGIIYSQADDIPSQSELMVLHCKFKKDNEEITMKLFIILGHDQLTYVDKNQTLYINFDPLQLDYHGKNRVMYTNPKNEDSINIKVAEQNLYNSLVETDTPTQGLT